MACPSVTLPNDARSCVLAPTVVSHGLGWLTVLAPGPDVSGRHRYEHARPEAALNASHLHDVPGKLVDVPLMEKLIDVQPSATAWSIAAAESVVKQPPVSGVPVVPAALVGRDAGTGSHAADRPEACCGPGRCDVVVPSSGRRRVRSVTVGVARRAELVRCEREVERFERCRRRTAHRSVSGCRDLHPTSRH